VTEAIVPNADRAPRRGDPARALIEAALQRARLAIFWERLWPALATLATGVGVFLALSWLGLWLWLPPLARAAGVIACGLIALAAAAPFIFLRVPDSRDGLTRLIAAAGCGIGRQPRSPTNSPSRRKIPIRWRCGMRMSNGRWLRRAP